MTSIRPRFHPIRHISIPLHQVADGQRSFGVLGNNRFKDRDFLRDHAQIAFERSKRRAHCFPSGDYPSGQHHTSVGFVLRHFTNIPAGVAGVNREVIALSDSKENQ